jgi:hypothetical protein
MRLIKVEGQTIDLDMAKRNCGGCHGTGIYGTICETNGARTILVCSCVIKAMSANQEREKQTCSA